LSRGKVLIRRDEWLFRDRGEKQFGARAKHPMGLFGIEKEHGTHAAGGRICSL
jgi:hypothetical protein